MCFRKTLHELIAMVGIVKSDGTEFTGDKEFTAHDSTLRERYVLENTQYEDMCDFSDQLEEGEPCDENQFVRGYVKDGKIGWIVTEFELEPA